MKIPVSPIVESDSQVQFLSIEFISDYVTNMIFTERSVPPSLCISRRNILQTENTLLRQHNISTVRELSFLLLGTGVEELLEGCYVSVLGEALVRRHASLFESLI